MILYGNPQRTCSAPTPYLNTISLRRSLRSVSTVSISDIEASNIAAHAAAMKNSYHSSSSADLVAGAALKNS